MWSVTDVTKTYRALSERKYPSAKWDEAGDYNIWVSLMDGDYGVRLGWGGDEALYHKYKYLVKDIHCLDMLAPCGSFLYITTDSVYASLSEEKAKEEDNEEEKESTAGLLR